MTPLQRYIAEEIATDHVDGLLSRREALRRLALLGVGSAAATALLAACGESRGPTAATTSTAAGKPSIEPGPPPGIENAVQTTPITWAEGRTRRAHAFDRTGRHFVLLDDTGVTHWLDAQAQWRVAKTLPVVAQMPTAAPFPTLLSSRARDTLFVTDVAAKQIAVIDSQNIAVTQRIGLDFSPNGQAWLGIAAP